MNIFHLLGYDANRPFSQASRTNVGLFALVGGGAPPVDYSNIYYGPINITAVYLGSQPISAIYLGSQQVFLDTTP